MIFCVLLRVRWVMRRTMRKKKGWRGCGRHEEYAIEVFLVMVEKSMWLEQVQKVLTIQRVKRWIIGNRKHH
jgi:hypothetical protein